jgi:SAM-dependent methyltransferase
VRRSYSVNISLRATGIRADDIESTAGYWNQASDEWQAEGCDALWRRHSDAVNISFLSSRLPQQKVARILKTDVFDESSTAGLMPLLTQRARSVVGMDISPAVLRAARKRHPSLIETAADVRRLPFAENSFDCIVSNSTLDHFTRIEELIQSLCELGRVLRPGGRLIVMLDNPSNPIVGLRNALPFNWLNRLGIVPYYVGRTIGARELVRYIKAAGLNADEVTYTLHCPRFLAVLATRLISRCQPKTQQRLLRFLMAFERLSRFPTRAITGYFVVVCASKADA